MAGRKIKPTASSAKKAPSVARPPGGAASRRGPVDAFASITAEIAINTIYAAVTGDPRIVKAMRASGLATPAFERALRASAPPAVKAWITAEATRPGALHDALASEFRIAFGGPGLDVRVADFHDDVNARTVTDRVGQEEVTALGGDADKAVESLELGNERRRVPRRGESVHVVVGGDDEDATAMAVRPGAAKNAPGAASRLPAEGKAPLEEVINSLVHGASQKCQPLCICPTPAPPKP